MLKKLILRRGLLNFRVRMFVKSAVKYIVAYSMNFEDRLG